MTAKTFNPATLRQFTGTENVYRHGLVRSILYTDGAKYVAESAGAYWLLDEIAFAQKGRRAVAAEEFEVWKLAVNADGTGRLTCEDGNGRAIFTKRLADTDFPPEGVELYFVNSTILLPSEYWKFPCSNIPEGVTGGGIASPFLAPLGRTVDNRIDTGGSHRTRRKSFDMTPASATGSIFENTTVPQITTNPIASVPSPGAIDTPAPGIAGLGVVPSVPSGTAGAVTHQQS